MKQLAIRGMDISFVDEIEQAGGVYLDGNQPVDCLKLMKDNGINAARLRIWNEPAGGFCNLERTLAMAKRIKALGMQLLLDFHYSDKWADPANQWKPQAWEHLAGEELQQAVYQYTYDVLAALKQQDTLPDMVQIGNEVTPGMLWDEGKVDGELDTDEQWSKFTALLKAGISAAKTVDARLNIMIHIDRGGDQPASYAFYDRLQQFGVEFDTIGLSYYPWWHGTLEDLQHNLYGLALRYGKEITVVETAYPWTLEPREGFQLIVEKEEQLHAGYPATVEGQINYLQDFMSIIQRTPNDKGIGYYWWEPAWIPSKASWSVGHDNNWSNLTLFDYEGRKLESLPAAGQL